MPEYKYANTTAWVTELVCLHKDEQWPADDPIVRRFSHCFTDQIPESVLRGGGVRSFDNDGNPSYGPPPANSPKARRG
jgi:hypothetical protein